MIASDRVVMGDGPAVRNHRVKRRALNGAPLCPELALLAKRVEREIGRGAVRIGMCEAAGDLPLRPVVSRIAFPVAALIASWNSSKRSHVIAVSNVSLITPRRISRSIA